MIPEKPKQAAEQLEKKQVIEDSEKNEKKSEEPIETRTEKNTHQQPRFRARYRPPNYQPPPTKVRHIQENKPTWLIEEISSTALCDFCGKNEIKYKAKLEGSNISIKRCEACLNQLKKERSKAIWKNILKKD